MAGGAYYVYIGKQSPAPVNEELMEVKEETVESPAARVAESTVQLAQQNESKQSGTAILTEKDGKVTVTLNITGGVADIPQPAHIHLGSCPNVGSVAYPLTNVVDGTSETVLGVTLADLAAKQPLGINVHKSAAEAKVYVSCGDLAL